MRAVWGGSYGFPGPLPVSPFKDYIRRNEFVADHFWSAYPEASTTMVLSALEVQERLRARPRADAHPGAVRAAYRRTHRPPAPPLMGNVAGQAYALSVLTPVIPDRAEALRRSRRPPAGRRQPARARPGTHYARWVSSTSSATTRCPRRRRRDPFSVPYLLFTSNLDGPLEPYLDLICERHARGRRPHLGPLRRLPRDHRDAAGVRRLARHNQFDTGFFVCAYPERTVGEVRSALEARERLGTFAIAAQAIDPRELQAAFLERVPAPVP